MIETSITREPEVTCWRYYYNEFYDKRRVKVLSAILQIVNFNIIVIIQISTNKGKSFNLFANYWPNQILRTFFRLSKESEQNPETRSFPKSNISNLIKSYIDLDIVNDLNRLKIFSILVIFIFGISSLGAFNSYQRGAEARLVQKAADFERQGDLYYACTRKVRAMTMAGPTPTRREISQRSPLSLPSFSFNPFTVLFFFSHSFTLDVEKKFSSCFWPN